MAAPAAEVWTFSGGAFWLFVACGGEEAYFRRALRFGDVPEVLLWVVIVLTALMSTPADTVYLPVRLVGVLSPFPTAEPFGGFWARLVLPDGPGPE